MADVDAEWWSGHDVDDDLIVEATALLSFPITTAEEIETVASCYVYGGFRAHASIGELPPDNRPQLHVWETLKREFHALCCTKDRKYQQLRAELAAKTRHANSVLVGTMAAAFATQLGVSAGAIAALVAVLFAGLLRLGRETMCAVLRPAQ